MNEEEQNRIKLIYKNRKNSVFLAIELINELPALVRSDDNLYVYNGKHYNLTTTEFFEQEFGKFVVKYSITDRWKGGTISEILKFIKTYSKIETIEMNNTPHLLCLNNGVLNINTMEFFEHSKDFYFDTSINIDYEPNNKLCPVFLEYLNNVVRGNKETVDNIIRLGGYLLDYSPDNIMKCNKMFIFDGYGGSGKSTLLNVFKLFFSKKQLTSLSLEELSGKNFENAQLLYSRVNISGEQKRAFIDAEKLKMITEGSEITIRGLYKEAVTMRPKTKMIVACNGLPKFNDTSDGIYRRLVIFRFPNQYKNKNEYSRVKNPEEYRIYPQDRDLFSKIEKEKSAIFNLFVIGLKRLRDDNFLFVEGNEYIKIMEEFKSDNDVAREFLKDKYIVDKTAETPIKLIFEEFKIWYSFNVGNHSFKFRSNELGRRVREMFNVESNGRKQFRDLSSADDGVVNYEYSQTYPLRRIIYAEETNNDAEINISGESLRKDTYTSDSQQSIGL